MEKKILRRAALDEFWSVCSVTKNESLLWLIPWFGEISERYCRVNVGGYGDFFLIRLWCRCIKFEPWRSIWRLESKPNRSKPRCPRFCHTACWSYGPDRTRPNLAESTPVFLWIRARNNGVFARLLCLSLGSRLSVLFSEGPCSLCSELEWSEISWWQRSWDIRWILALCLAIRGLILLLVILLLRVAVSLVEVFSRKRALHTGHAEWWRVVRVFCM